MAIDDDFEKTAAGMPPAHATVSGEKEVASIRVSEDRASAGRRSLKITDSESLQPSWEPQDRLWIATLSNGDRIVGGVTLPKIGNLGLNTRFGSLKILRPFVSTVAPYRGAIVAAGRAKERSQKAPCT